MATIAELTIADEPERWAGLGFVVEGGTCQVGGVSLRLAGVGAVGDGAGAAAAGLVGWTLAGVASGDLDGLPTAHGDAAAAAPASVDGAAAAAADPTTADCAAAHPNGVTAVDHVVVVSPDLDRTVAALTAAGLDLRRVRERATPAGAPRQAFFRLGAVILEVVAEPDDVRDRSGGRDRPAFFWGIALRAPDLDRTVAALGDQVSKIRPAVQPGRRIATLRRSAGLALPVALMTDPPVRTAPT